jgi:hypothetical protein
VILCSGDDNNKLYDVQQLKQLWMTEKLLCKNKEFLSLMMSGFMQETVKSFVQSHVKRLKTLIREWKATTPIYENFLSSVNIEGHPVSYYRYHANTNRFNKYDISQNL